MQKTRQQLGCLSPRKRPKTMQNELRSSFLAPFRADRATAASGIVVRMAVDDLRQKAAAAAHGMSVYVWSAFLAGTRLRAKIAPWAARFGMGLPSHHGVHARGSEGAEIGAGGGHTPSLRVFRFVGAAAPFAAGSSARTPPETAGGGCPTVARAIGLQCGAQGSVQRCVGRVGCSAKLAKPNFGRWQGSHPLEASFGVWLQKKNLTFSLSHS